MNDETQPLRSPSVQIAVSRTPVDSPDRSLPRVFPKWLKVAKLWFQGKALVVMHCHTVDRGKLRLCFAEEDKRKAQVFSFAAVMLAAATTILLLWISYAQAAFQTTMSKRDEGASACPSSTQCMHNHQPSVKRGAYCDMQWASQKLSKGLCSSSSLHLPCLLRRTGWSSG